MATLTFQNPEYLWFLLAIPLLVVTHFFFLRYARRKALKFANFKVLKRATGERFITKNYTILILRLLVMACVIFAVAQTTIWYEGITNENDYVLAIDTSASMAAQDIQPTRLDAAKSHAEGFIDALDGGVGGLAKPKAGIVSFSGVTLVEEPLTRDRADLRDALSEITISASGTDIPGAIITSTNLLLNSERGRAIVLITDGSNTIETFQSRSLQRATRYARGHRVRIFAIGVGSELKTPLGYLPQYYNISATYGNETLAQIVNATDGRYYATSDQEALQEAFDDIRRLDTESTLSFELTGGLMMIALLLLMVEWGLVNTRFRILP